MRWAWLAVVPLTALWLGAGPVRAAWEPAAGFGSYSWDEYPAPELHSQAEKSGQLYPDRELDPSWRVDYGEYELPDGRTFGLVTLAGQPACYLSLIHYQADGRSHVLQVGLSSLAGLETTLTFELPPAGNAGISRLLLWNAPPPLELLARLAQQPNQLSEPLGGVLNQWWFVREARGAYLPAWEDPLQPFPLSPPVYSLAYWPWCRAQPTLQGAAQAKDCAVEFSGATRLIFGEYGSHASWEMDWASELRLAFVLPPSQAGSEVELYLWESEESARFASTWPALDISVNGWPMTSLGYTPYNRSPGEPIVVPLSQYVTSGENVIRLRVSALAETWLLLDGIELWVY